MIEKIMSDKNICQVCKNQVGNDVFTVCDDCWIIICEPDAEQKLTAKKKVDELIEKYETDKNSQLVINHRLAAKVISFIKDLKQIKELL